MYGTDWIQVWSREFSVARCSDRRWISTLDGFAIQFEHQAEHAVRRRVLTEVEVNCDHRWTPDVPYNHRSRTIAACSRAA